MSAEHGGEVPLRYELGYSPFGIAGRDVGELAYVLRLRLESSIKELPYEPGRAPRWTDDDRLAFGYLLDLEASLPELAREVREVNAEDRFPELHRLRFSLPFVAPYWRWMNKARAEAWRVTIPQALELVKRGGSFPYEEILMQPDRNGHSVDGMYLAHLWTTWRRGIDEHSHGRDLASANEVLDQLGSQLLPCGPRAHIIVG